MVDASDFIVDIREFDVPYHVRVAIDKGDLCDCFDIQGHSDHQQILESESGIQWRLNTALQLSNA